MTAHPQDDLPGLLLGELPPSTAVSVDRHLAGCDPCRRDLAAVAVASSALRDVARLPVKAVDLPPLRLRPRRAGWLLGAVAAVLVALVLVVGGLTIGRDREQTVALGGPAASGASAEARMRGAGDDQVMTITATGLPRPPAGAWYEVWLVGDPGEEGAINECYAALGPMVLGYLRRFVPRDEAEGHHPDIELGWGRVAVTLTTHAAGGLTDNDFILAAKLDRL